MLFSARRFERIALTFALITEFYSVDFLQHRISVHETWQRNRRGEVDIARVAAGGWYPGSSRRRSARHQDCAFPDVNNVYGKTASPLCITDAPLGRAPPESRTVAGLADITEDG